MARFFRSAGLVQAGAVPVAWAAKQDWEDAPDLKSQIASEFDPFAPLCAILIHIGLFASMLVMSLGDDRPQPKPLIQVEMVMAAPEPPQITIPVTPPPMLLREQEAGPLGKGDSADTLVATKDPPGRPDSGVPQTPSENRLLNETPSPTGAPTPDRNASTAAIQKAVESRKADLASAPDPHAAAADTKPAGQTDNAVKPTAPGPSLPGSSRPAGEGLSVAAGVIRGAMPAYPPAARQKRLEGKVLLQVVLYPDGRVRNVVVVQSSGHTILDNAAREGVARWRFSPAKRATVSVASTIEVPVEFKITD